MAYLGRGRSFRGASPQHLVRHGAGEFVLFGRAAGGSREMSIGVRNSRDGLEIHIAGDKSQGVAKLAEILPLQIVDPDVHNLVAGGPEERRRYLDWMAFHVEHGYLTQWRRFRRALKQRNAALKDGAAREGLSAWDREFSEAGVAVDAARSRIVEMARPVIQGLGASLVGSVVDIEYRRGWGADQPLAKAVAAGIDRDRLQGSTQYGPHRADLRLVYDERQARRLVSRGQQKLLACTLILAATEVVQGHLERPLMLLLDDPAAELDADSLARLMGAVVAMDCQVIATSLDPRQALFPEPPKMFHVEQGVVTATHAG